MRLNSITFKPIDLLYVYLLFLLFVPNDVYYSTSLYIFEKPSFIHYDLYKIPISILYFPIVLFGVYLHLVKRNKDILNFYVFFILLFIKDVIYIVFFSDYILLNNSFELYFQYFISFFMVIIIFSRDKSVDALYKFWDVFILINAIGLVISIFTGIGTGLYGFEKRYHSPNLTQGETAFIFALYIVHFLFQRQSKYKSLIIISSILLLLSTGSRKDIVYVLFFISIYFLKSAFVNFRKKGKKFNLFTPIKFFLICTTLITTFILFKDILFEKLDFERILEPIFSLFTGDFFTYATRDSSGQGRLDSINAAISILNQYPLGLSFSFFESQYMMQSFNYPTFVHSTIIFYYLTMGICIIIPIYFYVKYFIKLLIIKNKLSYVYIYMFIYNTLSGGALLDFKVIFMYFFLLCLAKRIINEHTQKWGGRFG